MTKKTKINSKNKQPRKSLLERWQVLISVIIAIGTFLFGIWEFSEDSKRRAASAAFEARKPFLVMQLDLCLNASETAAKLASTIDPKSWKQARERFWVLYWGPLSVVETPLDNNPEVFQPGQVEKQMVAIGKIVKDVEANPQLPVRDLEQLAFGLAHNCRDLILESWRVQ